MIFKADKKADKHGDIVLSDIEKKSDELIETTKDTRAELEQYYTRLAEEQDFKTEESARFHRFLRSEITSLKNASANIMKTYLNLFNMTDELETRLHEAENSGKKRIIPAAPANAAIDFKEKTENHFARGINMYKLFIICFVGSFAGVIIEILWCFIRNGYIESRSGLVYGPFNLLYGLGAVVLTLALYKFRNRSGWLSFLGGMAVGSAVEYLCSFAQEAIFGSRSWDYSGMAFNLNGRICLMYSVFWGFLGVVWIKNIYPRMAKFILCIPNRTGKIAVWVLTAFMVLNAAVSGLSVWRWSERIEGIQPSGKVCEFIDRHFPNERMERIYANMEF